MSKSTHACCQRAYICHRTKTWKDRKEGYYTPVSFHTPDFSSIQLWSDLSWYAPNLLQLTLSGHCTWVMDVMVCGDGPDDDTLRNCAFLSFSPAAQKPSPCGPIVAPSIPALSHASLKRPFSPTLSFPFRALVDGRSRLDGSPSVSNIARVSSYKSSSRTHIFVRLRLAPEPPSASDGSLCMTSLWTCPTGPRYTLQNWTNDWDCVQVFILKVWQEWANTAGKHGHKESWGYKKWNW